MLEGCVARDSVRRTKTSFGRPRGAIRSCIYCKDAAVHSKYVGVIVRGRQKGGRNSICLSCVANQTVQKASLVGLHETDIPFENRLKENVPEKTPTVFHTTPAVCDPSAPRTLLLFCVLPTSDWY